MTLLDLKKQMREEWFPVKGYEECYEITKGGDVRSVKRPVRTKRKGIRIEDSQPMKTRLQFGYPALSLRKDGKQKHRRLHRLLAINFIPNPKKLPFVNHKNGKRDDFRLDNLEWCTLAENTRDAMVKGQLFHKLTKEQVIVLRSRKHNWASMMKSAEKYQVSVSTIDDAVKGRTWKHVPMTSAFTTFIKGSV